MCSHSGATIANTTRRLDRSCWACSFVGREQARAGIQLFFDRYPNGLFGDTEVMVAGGRGAAEWTFRATGDDGQVFEVPGCDLFEFDGDLIRVKNAFRKVRD